MTSSPGSTTARRADAIASVAPHVTVTSVSGSTVIPYQSAYFRARASRNRLAPQVMAYWLMSSRIARAAASFRGSGAEKFGNPWPRCSARQLGGAPVGGGASRPTRGVSPPRPATHRDLPEGAVRADDTVPLVRLSLDPAGPLFTGRLRPTGFRNGIRLATHVRGRPGSLQPDRQPRRGALGARGRAAG